MDGDWKITSEQFGSAEPYQSQYNQDYKEGLELLTQLGIGVY